ncbi:MAG TPA: cysteine-rich CWC family protein [Polyangiaceae bacterium]|nr:cysteine-rich CWC family protein [Polyangiaceae bacterium]
MPADLDPSRCPLCGGPNGCAMAGGGDGAACWCMSVEIPDAVHARIPEAARDTACVCAKCARGEPRAESTSRALRTVAR